jgi:hypothetical protein
LQKIGMAKPDEVIEWACIGNDDHACGYRVFVASNRSNVAMSLFRSPTV